MSNHHLIFRETSQSRSLIRAAALGGLLPAILLAGCLADGMDADDEDADGLPGGPEEDSYLVGGVVEDMSGAGLLLTLNDQETLTLDAPGSFQFDSEIEEGESYSVTVTSAPDGEACQVDNGSGMIADQDIDDVLVSCEDFTVIGLSGQPGTVTVHQIGPGEADLLYSSDPDCDWHNLGQCADSGVIQDATAGDGDEMALELEALGVEAGTVMHFALQTDTSISAPGSGVLSAGKPISFDGNVWIEALETGEERLYVGGNFQWIGLQQSAALLVPGVDSGTSGLAINAGQDLDGIVRRAIPDGEGGWYLAGIFRAPDSDDLHMLQRLDASGRLDPDFQVTTEDSGGPVSIPANAPAPAGMPDGDLVNMGAYDAELHDGTLYLGGPFEIANGEPRAQLAAVNAETGELLSDNPGEALSPLIVSALHIHEDKLFVGGGFAHPDGFKGGLKAIDLNSGDELPDWNLTSENTGLIHHLLSDNNRLYAGGMFDEIDGVSRQNIAAIELESANVLSEADWATAVSGQVRAMANHHGRLYIGGTFHAVNGEQRMSAASVAIGDGTLDGNWDPGLYGDSIDPPTVRAIAAHDDHIYLGGHFHRLGHDGGPGPLSSTDEGNKTQGDDNGHDRHNIAVVDRVDAEPHEWRADVAGEVLDSGLVNVPVEAIGLDGDRVLLGGTLTALATDKRENLAAYDLDTGVLDPDWRPSTNGAVHELLLDGDRLFMGGRFSEVNGEDHNGMAALQASDGELVDGWQADVSGSGRPVRDMFVHEGSLYFSGRFRAVNSVDREGAAAVSVQDGSLQSWDPQISDHNNTAVAMTYHNDRIFLAGEFNEVGGQTRNNIVAVEPGGDGDVVTGWDAGDGPVASSFSQEQRLAAADGVVYVAGNIEQADGEDRDHFAAFNADNGDLEDWAPESSRRFIWALAVDGDRILAGARRITALDGRSLAAIDGDGGLDSEWTPEPDDSVSVIHVNEGRVYVGGMFSRINGESAVGFGVLDRESGELIW